MKAIILNDAGSVENFKFAELAIPAISEDEVFVKVKTIGINPVDYKARSNNNTLTWLYADERPVILGWDISGKIESIGNAVTNFKVGDEVFGMVNFPSKGNAYAEYVVSPASHLALKPTSISYQEAAAATLAALTAWQVMKGKIKNDDSVLILGASGGVGHYATQIATHFGANVIGTSSEKNKNFVLQNGADQHIDYTKEKFEDVVTDIDFVLDTLGGENIIKAIYVTKNGGTIVTIPSGAIAEDYINLAKAKNINLSFILVQASGNDMKELADLLDKGIIKSTVSYQFSFNEMGAAHLQLETGRTVGKIVVNL